MKYEDMKNFEKMLKEGNAYVCASIEGNGHHHGRLKKFTLDADGIIVIDVDIDKESFTR